MKSLIQLFLLSLSIAFVSCKSVEALVEEGRYDDAIEKATKMLAGKKNKEVEHVKALEKAFAKINQRDLKSISNLRSGKSPTRWDEIYRIGLDIEGRQRNIEPLLPLVSSNGYEAHFDFVEVEPILQEAGDQASLYHYNEGSKKLTESRRTKDSRLAREAYQNFITIGRYIEKYKDVDILIEEALNLGINHILVNLDDSFYEVFPLDLPDLILREVFLPKTQWMVFHKEFRDDFEYDGMVNLVIDRIFIGPEREQLKEYSREVEAQSPEPPSQDTSSNIPSPPVFITINFEENIRSKVLELEGHFELVDLKSDRELDTKKFAMLEEFSHTSLSHNGDSRAKQKKFQRGQYERPEPFPTDLDMIAATVNELASKYEKFIKSVRLF